MTVNMMLHLMNWLLEDVGLISLKKELFVQEVSLEAMAFPSAVLWSLCDH